HAWLVRGPQSLVYRTRYAGLIPEQPLEEQRSYCCIIAEQAGSLPLRRVQRNLRGLPESSPVWRGGNGRCKHRSPDRLGPDCPASQPDVAAAADTAVPHSLAAPPTPGRRLLRTRPPQSHPQKVRPHPHPPPPLRGGTGPRAASTPGGGTAG